MTHPLEEPRRPLWTNEPQQLTAGSGSRAIADSLTWLEHLGAQQHWPAATLFALSLCADEALANIHHHARRADGQPVQLWLRCGPTQAGLALRIEDDGLAFDPTTQPSPQLATSLDEADIGGHGLRLMRHYLHQLIYERHNERNVLWLELEIPHTSK